MDYKIKTADKSNLADLYDIAHQMNATKIQGYFEKTIELIEAGEREVYLMCVDNKIVGYTMFSFKPKYGFYRIHNIPEIQDLNIIPSYRQYGLGRALIKHCEARAVELGYQRIGIGVGLTPSYGPAQRLYAKMGYIPDGFGVTYDRKTLSAGALHPFDDDVSLMLEKPL